MKERVSTQYDIPCFLKIHDIGIDLEKFATVIDIKYSQIDFEFAFCFRVLYTTKGISSKVRFYKDDKWLGMDLIMGEDEFSPYKKIVLMQRRIMGKYFFPFFVENIKKYRYKLPVLKPIEKDLIADMRLFLVENLWLEDEDGKLKISIIETVPFERALELFG